MEHQDGRGASASPSDAKMPGIVVALMFSIVVVASSGCAYAPAFRPVGPPLLEQNLEAGVGGVAVVGQEQAGGGMAAWVTGRVARDLLLVGRGHVTEALPLAQGSTSGGLRQDQARQWGGAVGLRGLFDIRPGILAGGELALDYTQFSSFAATQTAAAASSSLQHFLSLTASLPVAEEVFPDVFVYVTPTLGAGYRLGDVDIPFGGYVEAPIGVAWRLRPWLVVMGEGGVSLPFSGGYLALGAGFRL